MKHSLNLSRRERQIMDVIYAQGECSVDDVLKGVSDPPTRTAVRTLLRILERKGHVTHRKVERHFVYRPTRPHGQTARSALRHLLTTFFSGSFAKAAAAYMSDPGMKLSTEELDHLRDMIERASKKDR